MYNREYALIVMLFYILFTIYCLCTLSDNILMPSIINRFLAPLTFTPTSLLPPTLYPYFTSLFLSHSHIPGDDVAEPVQKLKKKLSDLGCRSVLKMIFFDNFVHGIYGYVCVMYNVVYSTHV